jgi:biopolymer transport protein ExbD
MARRAAPEINAGSMADIAFLLLIFFLVTTTMDVDKGLARKLPPIQEDIPDMPPIKKRNLFAVLINSNNDLLVNGDYMTIKELRAAAKKFINNNDADPESSESPLKAIVSLQNDRGTSYNIYIAVQNELAAAYRELRDEEAMRKYGKNYESLGEEEQKAIAGIYPLNISEAEPVNLGG